MRALLTMLPRLNAERQLAAIQAGSIRLQIEDSPQHLRELARIASGREGRRRGARATPEALAAIGVGVVMEAAHG